MALVVLDTSIVIAFLDPDDALHEAAVQALADRQHDELIVPASAYAEMLVGPYRSGAKAVAEVESFLADFAIRIEPITATNRPRGCRAPWPIEESSSSRRPRARDCGRARGRDGADRRCVMGERQPPRHGHSRTLTDRS